MKNEKGLAWPLTLDRGIAEKNQGMYIPKQATH
jgi:hypothetical protein